MKRRLLLFGVFPVTACATAPTPMAPPPPPPTAMVPPAPTPAGPPSPELSPAPASAQPPGAGAFDRWIYAFRSRALAAGISPAALDRELAGLTPDPAVARLDAAQPEFSRPVSAYVKDAVTPAAVAEGARRLAELPWATEVEARYGVPAPVLAAIWGRETGYGRILGTSDVVRAIATRTANGKDRFEADLIAALRLLDSGEVARGEFRGSWAGAWGQTQFMPTNVLQYAVDADGNGRRDLRASTRDALTSTAAFLQAKGWKPGLDWTREVVLPPRFDFGLAEEETQPLNWWAAQGVRRADGRPWSVSGGPEARARLLLPAGAGGPAFLAFDNYDVILTYNRSMAYALAVGLLADGVAGRGGLVRAWPEEAQMARADVVAAQATLKTLGFDPGAVDGQTGADTRRAVRAWQRARGLPADGYLSPDVVARLKRDGGS